MRKPCETCGRTFNWRPTAKGGRPPKHCPTCRKPRGGQVIDLGAAREKRAVRRRELAKAAESSTGSAEADRIVRFAAGLSFLRDPTAAAEWAGLGELEPKALRELEKEARRLHADLADPANTAGLLARLRAAIAILVQRVGRGASFLTAQQAAAAIGALAKAQVLIGGEEGPVQYTELVLQLRGPDGTVTIEPPKEATTDDDA